LKGIEHVATVIKVIGTVIVVMGLVYLIKPQILKEIMRFFAKGGRLYLAALVRFALAIVFFLGARHCGIRWVIVMFGLIFLLSGLLIFMLGLQRARGIINWYQKQPIVIFRIMAIVVLIVGLIILYSA
jgi:uncharacterized protein YjeT (DUF2065 family)